MLRRQESYILQNLINKSRESEIKVLDDWSFTPLTTRRSEAEKIPSLGDDISAIGLPAKKDGKSNELDNNSKEDQMGFIEIPPKLNSQSSRQDNLRSIENSLSSKKTIPVAIEKDRQVTRAIDSQQPWTQKSLASLGEQSLASKTQKVNGQPGFLLKQSASTASLQQETNPTASGLTSRLLSDTDGSKEYALTSREKSPSRKLSAGMMMNKPTAESGSTRTSSSIFQRYEIWISH